MSVMKICFYHEDFDTDVSSGTIHAQYQWFELLHAFGITECAVINTTLEPFTTISSDIKFTEFSNLAEFISGCDERNLAFVEMGGTDFRDFDYSNIEWLIFGSANGTLPRQDVSIPTVDNVALYPREAAAIVISNAILK